MRAAILAEDDTVATGLPFETHGPARRPHAGTWSSPLGDRARLRALRPDSIAGRAEAAGVTPLEIFYDLMLEFDGEALFLIPYFNYAEGSHDAILEMLQPPGRRSWAWPTAAPTWPPSATPRCPPTS